MLPSECVGLGPAQEVEGTDDEDQEQPREESNQQVDGAVRNAIPRPAQSLHLLLGDVGTVAIGWLLLLLLVVVVGVVRCWFW